MGVVSKEAKKEKEDIYGYDSSNKKDRKTKKKTASDSNIAEDKPKVKKKKKSTDDKTTKTTTSTPSDSPEVASTPKSSEQEPGAVKEQEPGAVKERKKKRSTAKLSTSSSPSIAAGLQEKPTKKTEMGKVVKSEKKMLRAKERRKAQKKATKEKMKVRKARKLAAAPS